jgi:hypothetical protein
MRKESPIPRQCTKCFFSNCSSSLASIATCARPKYNEIPNHQSDLMGF